MDYQKDYRKGANSVYNLEQIGGRRGAWINRSDHSPANGRYIGEFQNGQIEEEQNFLANSYMV